MSARPRHDVPIREVVDIALGAGVAAAALTATIACPFVSTTVRAVRVGTRVAHDRPPARLAHRLADRGADVRTGLVRAAAEIVRTLLPPTVEEVDSIIERVDPDEIVARVDIESALDHLDLTAIARQVIGGLDLAPVLPEASSAASSPVARSVRTEGMNADETVARFFDRWLRRHPADGQ